MKLMINLCKSLLSRGSQLGCINCIQRRSLAESRAVELAYYSYENRKKDVEYLHPLIIQHGMMGQKSNWQHLAKIFGQSGRKIYCIDTRNHGESPHSDEMDYFVMRDDIINLMDKEEIQQAVLMGHSMGGRACMVTALTQAERVSGLIVVDVSPTENSSDTSLTPTYISKMLEIDGIFHEMDLSKPMSKVREEVIKKIHSETGQNMMVAQFLAQNLIAKGKKYGWMLNLDAICNNYRTLATFPKFSDDVKYAGKTYFIGGARSDYINKKFSGDVKYAGKTYFIGGARSDYIKNEDYPKIKSLFPSAKIEYVAGAGHWVHYEQKDKFVELVNVYLEDLAL